MPDFSERAGHTTQVTNNTRNDQNTEASTSAGASRDTLARVREEIAIAEELHTLLQRKRELDQAIQDMSYPGGQIARIDGGATISAQSAIAICNLASRCPKFEGNPAKVVEFVKAICRMTG